MEYGLWLGVVLILEEHKATFSSFSFPPAHHCGKLAADLS